MSESWQDWRSKDYRTFLVEFYSDQLKLADRIVHRTMPNDALDEENYALGIIAVFGKVAPPAVYLKAEYDAWLHGNEEIDEKPAKSQVKSRWRPSKNEEIEWMPEQEATEQQMIDAMDPAVKETWYRKPRKGYQYGSIFRRKEVKK